MNVALTDSVEPGYLLGYIQTIMDPTVMNICGLS
jgi:hypothetical protein